MNTTMRTEDVLRKVQENATAHEETWKAARAKWAKELAAWLLEQHDRIVKKDLDAVEMFFNKTKPFNKLNEYRRAIEMLRAHQSETIELGPEDFSHLIQDVWSWSEQYAASTSQYL